MIIEQILLKELETLMVIVIMEEAILMIIQKHLLPVKFLMKIIKKNMF